MSYVPVYGKMWDDCANRTAHTSSRRGRVTYVGGEVNTHFGEVLSFRVNSNGTEPKMDLEECKCKLKEWQEKKNERYIKYYQEKISRVIEHNKLAEDKENVSVSINVKFLKEAQIDINGNLINEDLVDIMNQVYCKNWSRVVELLKMYNKGKCIFDEAVAQKV